MHIHQNGRNNNTRPNIRTVCICMPSRSLKFCTYITSRFMDNSKTFDQTASVTQYGKDIWVSNTSVQAPRVTQSTESSRSVHTVVKRLECNKTIFASLWCQGGKNGNGEDVGTLYIAISKRWPWKVKCVTEECWKERQTHVWIQRGWLLSKLVWRSAALRCQLYEESQQEFLWTFGFGGAFSCFFF